MSRWPKNSATSSGLGSLGESLVVGTGPISSPRDLRAHRPRPAERCRANSGRLPRARADLLAEFPDQGAQWGDPRRPDLRSIIFESFRLVYRVGPDEIAVLSVCHTRMQPDEDEAQP